MKKNNFIISLLISFCILGIIYFGFFAQNKSDKNPENPYKYDIEKYKTYSSDLNTYKEIDQLQLKYDKLYSILIDSEDNVYLSADSYIVKFKSDGTLISEIDTGSPVYSIARQEKGDLYLGREKSVEILDVNGNIKPAYSSFGPKTYFTSISLSQNFLFIADAGNLIVWKIDLNSGQRSRIGDKNPEKEVPGFIIPSYYFDIGIDDDGFLWVVNPGRHSFENYTNNGGIRTSWGSASIGIEGFLGCCNPTHFVFLENGSFVTSEKGVARVKVYDRLGDLTDVIAGPESFDEGTTGLDLAVDSSQKVYVLDPARKQIRIFKKKKAL